ncbi:MAG: LacI family DNA-binding transcriptional regulator [Roseiflexaceae bacterium]
MPTPKGRPRGQVTIDEVARRAGVSISTVSRVLNRTASIGEEATARVLAAVAELGYVPQTAARNLAQGKTQAVGLALPEVGSDFFMPLLRGITAGASAAGYNLLIAIQPPQEVRPHQRPPLGKHNTDGMFVFGITHTDEELRLLHAQGFPVVLLYRSAPAGLDIPAITIENQIGTRLIIEHLIQVHGRRRIAFLRGPRGNEDSLWRERGYREALEAHGIPFDPALIGIGAFFEEPAQATVAGWLREGLAFDAVFAGDDAAACGVLDALGRAGLRVPEDVAVVGFDDAPIARHLSPPLTTVRAPTEQVGREAISRLIQLIETGSAAPVTLLPTELVVRRSCGCH